MANNHKELLESCLKQMRDLDVKRQVYEELRVKAICNRNECIVNGKYERAIVWEDIKDHCIDERILATQEIKDLYSMYIHLKAEMGI